MSGPLPSPAVGPHFVIDEVDEALALFDRPVSDAHLEAFAEWSRGRAPNARREASSRSAEERLLRQLCGRAVATSSRADAALAVRVVFQNGAWVGPPDRDRLWVNFGFPAWAAERLGLDPLAFLLEEAGRLGSEYADIVQGVLRYVKPDALVDWQDRHYVAVRTGGSVDLVHRWSFDLHDQLSSSMRGWQGPGSRPGWELPWLDAGTPTHDTADPLAAHREQLDRLAAEPTSSAAPADPLPTEEAVTVFVGELATRVAIAGDLEAATRALRVASAAEPRLIPAVLHAAATAPVAFDPGWVDAVVASLAPEQQQAIAEGRQTAGRTGPEPYVETGIRQGPIFALPWTG